MILSQAIKLQNKRHLANASQIILLFRKMIVFLLENGQIILLGIAEFCSFLTGAFER
jgi:hypothetical protein